MECSIDGCGNRRKYSTVWCQTHYHRWWRTGTTDLLDRPRVDRESLTYRNAHAYVRKEWDHASGFPCVACGERADEWAYDGTDPSEKSAILGGKWPVRYSVWPEFYMPMCFPCHRLKDASERAEVRTHFACGHPRIEENIHRRRDGRPNGCRSCKLAHDQKRYWRMKESV